MLIHLVAVEDVQKLSPAHIAVKKLSKLRSQPQKVSEHFLFKSKSFERLTKSY